MADKKKRLGEILVESGEITNEQLNFALKEQKSNGKRLGETLIALKFLTEKKILQTLEKQLNIPYKNLGEEEISEEGLNIVPLFLAERYNMIPIKKEEKKIFVAMNDPTNFFAIDDVRMVSGLEVVPILAEDADIKNAISQYYGVRGRVVNALGKLKENETPEIIRNVQDDSSATPVVSIVNSLIKQAVKDKASDIHIEPQDENVRVRFRLDGVLRTVLTFPKNNQAAIISRIKIMAKMDIAERRLPQDGRINIKENNREIDLRVSSLPTILGEKIVMRVLDKSAAAISIDKLGFSKKNRELFEQAINSSYGLILVTGPTGSGKSTTLYSTLMQVNTIEKNIITVEDPVEYRINGINQVYVNNKAGLNFANSLRTILRQDPDIIMVGEIRDSETADITVNAALTGHLVFSTLHTNDAAGAITRLVDMGVEPFLVTSSVRCVIAQRLVRKICPNCKIEYTPDRNSNERSYLGKGPDEPLTLYKGEGCSSCNFTGYKGRMAVHEILPIYPEMKELIMKGVEGKVLFDAGRKHGVTSITEDGIEKAMQGETTVSELLRVIYSMED